MNKTPLVSVIVPIYNVEKDLCTCIDSILAQTFTDFELILVNDGSTDCSGKICDEYALKDSRIKVLHKENGGSSDARNNGLDIAIGTRVCFIDADDYVDNNFLEIFNKRDADMVVQGLHCIYISKNSKKEYLSIINKKYKKEEIQELIYSLFKSKNIGFLHTRSFKREIIEKNNLRFNTNYKLREDQEFIFRYMLECNSFETVNEGAYHYNIPYNQPNKYKNIDFEQNILCTISIIENLRKMAKLTPITMAANIRMMAVSIFNLYKISEFNIDKIIHYTNIYNGYYKELRKVGYNSSSKIALFVYYIMGANCPLFMRHIYRFILRMKKSSRL